MTIGYNDLLKKLESLEHSFAGNSTKSFTGPCIYANEIRKTDNFQCFALDDSTSPRRFGSEPKLPVVVAIGGNYCDGITELPKNSFTGCAAVEDDLSGPRRNLEAFFNACRAGVSAIPGQAKPVWKNPDECPIPIKTNAGYLNQKSVPEKFHLVMTNFSPWITHKPWSHYRNRDLAFVLWLIQDGIKHGHVERLNNLIGGDVDLWVGHGCYDIYWFFRMLVIPGTALGIGNWTSWDRIGGRWAFTSNLSFSPCGKTVR